MFAVENDLSIQANYLIVENEVDISSFIDYNIAEQFFANIDWPANNNAHWRTLPDGKWRWIFYDLDAGFSDPNLNMFDRMMLEVNADQSNAPDVNASALYRNLLDNEGFKHRFIDRYAELLHTAFSADSTLLKLNDLEQLYSPEIEGQSERWGIPFSEPFWSRVVSQRIRSFLHDRPCIVRTQMIEFFDLEHFEFSCDDRVDFEKIGIAPNPSNGSFSIRNDSDEQLSILNVEVFDVVGRSVNISFGGLLLPGDQYDVDLQNVSNGVFFVRVDTGKDLLEKRVVVCSK